MSSENSHTCYWTKTVALGSGWIFSLFLVWVILGTKEGSADFAAGVSGATLPWFLFIVALLMGVYRSGAPSLMKSLVTQINAGVLRWTGSKWDVFWLSVFASGSSLIGAVFLWACTSSQANAMRVLGSLLLLGGACLFSGAMLGLLFGIPRALQNVPDAGKSGGGDSSKYTANTNLEQVSDWLTKILVGVGLTQLHDVPNFMVRVTSRLYRWVGFPPNAGGEVVVFSTTVYFGMVGFIFGYLLTRIFVAGALSRADRDLGDLASQLEDVRLELLDDAERAHLIELRHANRDNVPYKISFNHELPAQLKKLRRLGLLERLNDRRLSDLGMSLGPDNMVNIRDWTDLTPLGKELAEKAARLPTKKEDS